MLESRIKKVPYRKIVPVIEAWIDVAKKVYEKTRERLGTDSLEFLCFVTKQELRTRCEKIGWNKKGSTYGLVKNGRSMKERLKYNKCERRNE